MEKKCNCSEKSNDSSLIIDKIQILSDLSRRAGSKYSIFKGTCDKYLKDINPQFLRVSYARLLEHIYLILTFETEVPVDLPLLQSLLMELPIKEVYQIQSHIFKVSQYNEMIKEMEGMSVDEMILELEIYLEG